MNNGSIMTVISAVNQNKPLESLDFNAEEKAFYNRLIKQREEHKKKYGIDIAFEIPMECYDNLR